jgi:hypothetical protein
MKQFIIVFWIVLVSLVIGLISCEKSGSNCVTNSGEVIIESRQLADFDSIEVNGYVNLVLTQDTMNYVKVESGKNIIDGITTEVVDHFLVITNTNRCNWLRSYNVPVNVYISVRNLQKLYYESSGNVTTTNTITSESLTVLARDGCGFIEMNLNIQEGYFILQAGTVDFILHGHCSINSVYAGDYGLFNCKDLTTGYTVVTNLGSNDCYVRASQYLEASIYSIGSIYYLQTPDTLITHIKGEGKVLPY